MIVDQRFKYVTVLLLLIVLLILEKDEVWMDDAEGHMNTAR